MNTEISSEHSSDRLVYSVAELVRRSAFSRAFAYELVARGEILSVICLGRCRLVPKIALLALIEPDRPNDTTTTRGGSLNTPIGPSMLQCRRSTARFTRTSTQLAQGVATACRRGSPRGFAGAVKTGETEAPDVSGAGP
jgi:hypothetical protein